MTTKTTTVDERARDAYAMKAEGRTWADIADTLGLPNVNAARRLVMRHTKAAGITTGTTTTTKAPDVVERSVAVDIGTLEPGMRFNVHGQQGSFVYRGMHPTDGSITAWGGTTGHEMWRAFRPEDVRRIVTERPAKRRAKTATCTECARVFDLTDETDAAEWTAGHDCEVAE